VFDTGMVIQSGGTTQLDSGSARGTVSREEFLNILVAQLSYQDPLEPMDNAQFAQQIAQIESMRTSEELSNGIESLVRQQQVSSAGDLIGKYVRAADGEGGQVEGMVDSIAIDRTGVYLKVGEYIIPIGNVFEIQPEPPSE